MEEQGIMACMITENTVIIPWWGALASQLLCFKEDVTPCPILVVPFYSVSFYYLRLAGSLYLAFRGRWKHSSLPHCSFTSTVFWRSYEFSILLPLAFFFLMSTLKSCPPLPLLCGWRLRATVLHRCKEYFKFEMTNGFPVACMILTRNSKHCVNSAVAKIGGQCAGITLWYCIG